MNWTRTHKNSGSLLSHLRKRNYFVDYGVITGSRLHQLLYIAIPMAPYSTIRILMNFRSCVGSPSIQSNTDIPWNVSWSSQSHWLCTRRMANGEVARERKRVRVRVRTCVFLGGRRNRRAAVTRRCINNWWRQVRYVEPWDGVPLVSFCLSSLSNARRCFSRYPEVELVFESFDIKSSHAGNTYSSARCRIFISN